MKITSIDDIFRFFYKKGNFIPYNKGVILYNLFKNNEITEEQLTNYYNRISKIFAEYEHTWIKIIQERKLSKSEKEYLFELIYDLSKGKINLGTKEAVETLFDALIENNIDVKYIPHITIGAKKASMLRKQDIYTHTSELLKQINKNNAQENEKLYSNISYSYNTLKNILDKTK